MLILGALAAIALPVYMGQREKAWDGEAKSDARSLVSHIESCYAVYEDYTRCSNTTIEPTGLPLSATDDATPAQGEVSIEGTPAEDEFVIAARSRTNTLFRITRAGTGGYVRSCTPNGDGCHGTSW